MNHSVIRKYPCKHFTIIKSGFWEGKSFRIFRWFHDFFLSCCSFKINQNSEYFGKRQKKKKDFPKFLLVSKSFSQIFHYLFIFIFNIDWRRIGQPVKSAIYKSEVTFGSKQDGFGYSELLFVLLMIALSLVI